MCIKNENKNLKKAFSLIELLISLITISVIMAAMAPVVTHKLKHGGVSIGTKKLSMKCPATVGSQCTLCLGNQCIACPIGCGTQFKNTLTCKCETCTQANCVNCTSDRNKCDRCKSGYQKSGDGCSACGAGYYSNEGGTCQKCAKGTKANSSSAATGCTTCDGNKEYQDSEGQTTCKTCSGFVHNNYRSCTSCAAGTYWSASSSTCQSCGAGTYSNSANVTSCSSCPSGQYQPNSGQTSCISCSGAVNDSKTACRSCSDFGSTCIACNYYACTNTSCESKSSCTSTQKYDGCHCVGCPSGQVANADKSDCYTPSTAPTSCKDGEYLANSKCNPCPAGCTKCSGETSCTECKNATGDDPEYLLDGGKCKAYKKPNSQEVCNTLTGNTTIYIPDDYTKPNDGGFCMSKRNAGDQGGPNAIYSGTISSLKAGSSATRDNCTNTTGTKCCWTDGKTSGTCSGSDVVNNIPILTALSTVNKFNYESCNRTVCNWWAADYICRNIEPGNKKKIWNLPSKKVLESLVSAVNNGPTSKTDTSKFKIQRYSGNTGLQLCQSGTAQNTAGSPRCENGSICSGSKVNKCYPSIVWSLTNSEDGYTVSYYSGGLALGVYSTLEGKLNAYSVRCVMYKYIED